MHEIKIRAWDRMTKTMIPNIAVKNGNVFMKHSEKGYIEVTSHILMKPLLFTGLKDKNEKETYWDDIVSDGHNPPFKIEAYNYPMLARLSEIEFEIIGDIYRNPELLKN